MSDRPRYINVIPLKSQNTVTFTVDLSTIRPIQPGVIDLVRDGKKGVWVPADELGCDSDPTPLIP